LGVIEDETVSQAVAALKAAPGPAPHNDRPPNSADPGLALLPAAITIVEPCARIPVRHTIIIAMLRRARDQERTANYCRLLLLSRAPIAARPARVRWRLLYM